MFHRHISSHIFWLFVELYSSHFTSSSSNCVIVILAMECYWLIIPENLYNSSLIYCFPMFRFTCACQRVKLFQIFMDSLMWRGWTSKYWMRHHVFLYVFLSSVLEFLVLSSPFWHLKFYFLYIGILLKGDRAIHYICVVFYITHQKYTFMIH